MDKPPWQLVIGVFVPEITQITVSVGVNSLHNTHFLLSHALKVLSKLAILLCPAPDNLMDAAHVSTFVRLGDVGHMLAAHTHADPDLDACVVFRRSFPRTVM